MTSLLHERAADGSVPGEATVPLERGDNLGISVLGKKMKMVSSMNYDPAKGPCRSVKPILGRRILVTR